jgi:hypothetical protein
VGAQLRWWEKEKRDLNEWIEERKEGRQIKKKGKN